MKYIFNAVLLGLFSTTLVAGGNHEHNQSGHKYSVGEPGKGTPDRQVSVLMQDTMRFTFEPELGSLKNGETVKFIVRNEGLIRHEFSIGNAEDQVKHAEMMRKMPDMKHKDPNTVSLAPGESAMLSWRFKGTDTVVFACNIPGHFEAGMKQLAAIKGETLEELASN